MVSQLRTIRDESILRVLTQRVRVVSLDQLCQNFWPSTAPSVGSKTNVRARLRILESLGLIRLERAAVHQQLSLDRPLFSWSPGDPTPNFESHSYRLAKRFLDAPKPKVVYLATARAAAEFGGKPGKLDLSHLTHDLHVTALYFRFLRFRPELAEAWEGEDQLGELPGAGFLPDAILRLPDGGVGLVLEFGGGYPPERLECIHQGCERKGFPWQLW